MPDIPLQSFDKRAYQIQSYVTGLGPVAIFSTKDKNVEAHVDLEKGSVEFLKDGVGRATDTKPPVSLLQTARSRALGASNCTTFIRKYPQKLTLLSRPSLPPIGWFPIDPTKKRIKGIPLSQVNFEDGSDTEIDEAPQSKRV